ncbi:MAG: dihydrolipoyl dehydrogenase [Deltaproteobacteria bacterium]|nr:dihydrolipoyl dehydrogenase [Deltaproteobacteria bacterium]
MSEAHFDLVVIGAGPGGYVGAIRAAQLGMQVACIEKEPALGGTCLRVGCIPSKALLESSELYHRAQGDLGRHGIVVPSAGLDLAAMMKRKDDIVRQLTAGVAGLFKKNKVTRFSGTGTLQGRRDGLTLVRCSAADGSVTHMVAKHVLLATGSEPSSLPGVELDGDRVGTSTEALAFSAVPGHLVVVGAGVIGVELGSVWLRLGAKVTVLEYLDRILPGTDAEIAAAAQRVFKKQGMAFELGVKVTGARKDGDGAVVTFDKGGVEQTLRADRVLVAVGRKPYTAALGLDSVGLTTDKRGRIETDAHFATAVPGIFAIGDVIAGPMLAHKAEEEAVACVERLATGWGHVDYDSIPGIVYTDPEVATVGKSEEDLKAAGTPYRKGSFPFMANGRAKALGQTDGMVKILADAQTDKVLGCAIFGPRAGDLIAEVAVAMAFGASSEDIARACHAHPTLAEVVKEAALAVDGRAIHI